MPPRGTTDESASSGKGRLTGAHTKLRQQAARAVRILFTTLAVILALGAILVVLRGNVNEQNTIVELITGVADAVSGPFHLEGGVFDFSGENAAAKSALANWSIAAVVYLVVGRVLSSAIAPKSAQ